MPEYPAHLPRPEDTPALFARVGLVPVAGKFRGTHIAFDLAGRPTGGTVPCGCLVTALVCDRHGRDEGIERMDEATIRSSDSTRELARLLGVRAGFVHGVIEYWDRPAGGPIQGLDDIPEALEPAEHPSFESGWAYARDAKAALAAAGCGL
jgi:hypothetical protein